MAPPNSKDDLDEHELPTLFARSYSVCVLCIVSASVFFLTGVAPLPVLLYFPISRRFSFQPSGTELSMDFYGRSLLALLAGLAAALSAYALLQLRRKKPLAPSDLESPAKKKLLPLLTGYAATALLLAAGLYAYQLWVRVPTPLQLPTPPGDRSEAAE